MESALITVIVPIYNVAAYIDRCVDSIINQTYKNLEIILVDDGSTDGSSAKCDQWAARDSRITVVHQPNGGLSAARNTALDRMHGAMVTMVDGDDYIATDMVENLARLIEVSNANIAVTALASFYDGDEPKVSQGKVHIKIFTADEAIDDVFYQKTLNNSACTRLFRASIFKKLRFPVGMLYEDLAIAYDVLRAAGTVAFIDRQLYFYRKHSGSITATFSRKRTHVLDIMEGLEKRIAIVAPRHLPAVRSRLLSAYFNIFMLCPRDNEMADITTRCWTGIKRLRTSCLLDRHTRLKNKAASLLSYLGPHPLTWFKMG